jgi:hypothetical protein
MSYYVRCGATYCHHFKSLVQAREHARTMRRAGNPGRVGAVLTRREREARDDLIAQALACADQHQGSQHCYALSEAVRAYWKAVSK